MLASVLSTLVVICVLFFVILFYFAFFFRTPIFADSVHSDSFDRSQRDCVFSITIICKIHNKFEDLLKNFSGVQSIAIERKIKVISEKKRNWNTKVHKKKLMIKNIHNFVEKSNN